MTVSLALTPGEPAGVGPDLLIQTVQEVHKHAMVAFADPDLLLSRASQLGLPLTLVEPSDRPAVASELAVVPIRLSEPVVPGQLAVGNAQYVLDCIDAAVKAVQAGDCNGLVTGPVQKSIINDAGIIFTGHTEYLAALTHSKTVVMMLATDSLRVALATTHLPLRDVADAITRDLLDNILTVLCRDLKTRFGINNPRILVCGLNPHAGEGGHLGSEEIDIIAPALESFRQLGIDVVGPLPADTLFTPKYLDDADAVLAMYHDQGLPVLKFQGFGSAANITLGLPIIRTSVDHGTALDLAASGAASNGSLKAAIGVAVNMAKASNF
ncbi:MAG: 4-hydroxythreonine-4-phosphate dehydrogenase PdxA [Porticoccaceae bacterium]|jgi:4-hydroxythreonine-4-phosphate dehydrogenase|tara:strand:- start:5817 stop:6791 length:975 start_codon:yes stop_codon:yes gene_type:complete